MSNNSNTPILSIILLSFILFGCYHTKQGEVLSKERGESEIKGKYYEVEKYYNEDNIGLKVEYGNIKEVKYFKEAKKLKKKVHPVWYTSLVSGLSSLWFCKYAKGSTSYTGCVAIFSGLGLLFGASLDPDGNEYRYRGETMKFDKRKETKKEYIGNLSNKNIEVVTEKEVFNYESNSWGLINVSYDKIINDKRVKKDFFENIKLRLENSEAIKDIKIDKRKWMAQYALFKRKTDIKRDNSHRSSTIGSANKNQEIRIKSTEGDWVQINLSKGDGWVPSSSIDRFWLPPTQLDPNSLPSVTASINFKDQSGNNRLEGEETAKVEVTVRNEGEGPAYQVRADLKPTNLPNISYPSSVEFGKINSGSSITKTIHIEADREVSSKKTSITFHFRESNGFAPNPLRLQFRTRAFVPPKLTIADVGIDDASGDGIIDPGEVVDITARVRNASRGQAKNVRANVNFGEDVFAGPNTQQSFDLGNLGPKEHRDIRFSLVTSQQAKSVPVTVDLSEKFGEFGNQDIKLPLSFDQPTDQITEVQVEGQDNEVAVKTGGQLSIDVEANIPKTSMNRSDAVAVVIGIRNYSTENVPDVEYARRDARIMRQYLKKTLGFREENILPRNPDGRMTYAELRTLIRQKLPSYVKEGTSEVFVYYSGHGAPTTGEERRAYLVPSDTDPNFVSEDNAYRLSQFYKDLANLNAKSVTVALDACFTGQSGSGEMMIRQASPAVLSVENPFLALENGTAFLASTSEQVANWYPEKKHGMFTYFFLKGLKGAADYNNDQKLTVREMERYLTDRDSGVPYWSRRVHQRKQTPQVVGQDKTQVLVRYK